MRPARATKEAIRMAFRRQSTVDLFNRERLQTMRDEAYRAAVEGRVEWAKKVRLWEQGTLARPGVNWRLPPKPRSIKKILAERPPPVLTTGPASFWEIADLEKWRRPHGFELDWPHNISCRYAIYQSERSDLADAAANALQNRAAELAAAVWEKSHWSDDDDVVALFNPRFAVIHNLPLGELVTAHEQIQRIGGSASGTSTWAEACARLYLSKLQGVLEQVRAMASPAPAAPPSPRLQAMQGAASRTKPHPKTQDAHEPATSDQTSQPEPYPVRVDNHEQLADSIAARLASRQVTPEAPAGGQTTCEGTDPPKPDGPFGPRGFRWKGVAKEFPKNVKRLWRLAQAVWPQFRRRQSIRIDDVNTAYENAGGGKLSIDAAENYARDLSNQLIAWFPTFPARLQREDNYLRWVDLPESASPSPQG
jgi:hypothetical protein